VTTFRLPRRFILRSGAVGSRASAFAKAMAENCAPILGLNLDRSEFLEVSQR
jgi:hypothetical protein